MSSPVFPLLSINSSEFEALLLRYKLIDLNRVVDSDVPGSNLVTIEKVLVENKKIFSTMKNIKLDPVTY